MSYPIGMPMPYGMYNFNDLYGMLGLWAGQNQTNSDLLSQYLKFTPQQTSTNTQQQKVQDTQQLNSIRPEAQQSKTQTVTAMPTAEQTQSKVQQPVQAASQPPEPDADDGKISWKRKLKNIGKGMVNMAKGLFCDEKGFSLKRTLTTVAVAGAAAALTVATGGAAAPFLVAAGATMGAVQTGKGIKNAVKAKTDAEAEAAWQDIGAGTLSIGLSAAGAKGALGAAGKAVPKGNTVTSSAKATVESFKAVKDGVKTLATSPKETLTPLTKAETWSAAGGRLKTAWNETMPAKAAKNSTKEALGKAYDKDIAKLNKKADKLAKEIADMQSKPQTDALKLEIKQKTARLEKIYRDVNRIKADKANIGKTTNETALSTTNNQSGYINMQKAAADARKAAVEKLESNIKEIKTAMKDAPASRKAVYEKQLKAAKRKLQETKKLNKIDEQLDIIKYANAKNAKLKSALDKLNKKINDVESSTMSEAQKAIELAKLNGHKTNVEKLIAINKTQAAVAKAGLYKTNTVNAYKNMPGYEKALTAGITGSLNDNSVAENSAIGDYEKELAEYQASLEQQQAEYALQQEETHEQQPQQQTQQEQSVSQPAQTQTNQTNSQMPARNIYQDYYNAMNAISLGGFPLGFNDLYVSPYPDMIF